MVGVRPAGPFFDATSDSTRFWSRYSEHILGQTIAWFIYLFCDPSTFLSASRILRNLHLLVGLANNMSTRPSPSTWTVRFKRHKTTVLLHADSQETIASIKQELLNALRETSSDGITEGTPLPDRPEEIYLARPRDINDHSAGWKRVADCQGAGRGRGRAVPSKGKGKEKEGSSRPPKGVDAESLKTLGFKDNAVLAFKFASEVESEGDAKKRKADAMEEDELTFEGEDEDDIQEHWDVMIPKWEDQYGVENEGDVGAMKEFKG